MKLRFSTFLIFVILAVMAPSLVFAKETLADALSAEQLASIQEVGESHEYQADQNALMGLLTHALYKDREIFLREVISNAADALTKIRFASLTDSEALGTTPELEIRVSFDEEAGTLTITDTGVGMSGAGMEDHLGTIAKSGTKEFVQAATDAENASSLIGQFGVGFYSVYLVADEVTVISKNNSDDVQHVWFSSSDREYRIAADPRGDTLGRGTSIVLKLKENAAEFLDQERLEGLIQRYSAFIDYPIFLHSSSEIEEEIVVELTEEELLELEEKENEGSDPDADMDLMDEDRVVEDGDEEEDAGPKTRVEKVKKTVWEWQLVNEVKPVWTRPASEVTDEEYTEFFQALTEDEKAKPLSHAHFSAEGEVNFKSVLFFPEEQNQQIFMSAEPLRNIKLFVRRVFITDDFQEILPRYFGFVQGIVDSDDLPLNVGRGELQQSRLIRVIRRKLIRKVIAMIKKISADEEEYETFWTKFGTNVKLGVIEDQSNKLRLAKLLRFPTSVAGKTVEAEAEEEDFDAEVAEVDGDEEEAPTTTTLREMTSLDDYISRAKSHQTQIYYLAGSDKKQLAASPFVERLLRADYEVLFCDDPVDEYVMQSLREYEGYSFQDVSRDGVKIAESEAAEELDALDKPALKELGSFLKSTLVGKITKVKVSRRLTTSPAALSTGAYGASANMEKIIKAQAFAGGDSDPSVKVTKVLEINDRHPIIHALASKVEANPEDEEAKDLAELLYETSVLTSGFDLEDPAGFANRIHRFLKLSLDVSVDAEAEIVDYPEDEESPEDEDGDSLDYEEEELDEELLEEVIEDEEEEL